MNFIKDFINRLFKKQDLEIKPRLWKTDKCFKCNRPYNKKSFWAEFTEINGTVFQVPVCDNCTGKIEHEKPTNI